MVVTSSSEMFLHILRLLMNDQLPQMNGPPPVAGLVGESLVPVTDEIEWAAVSPRQITPEEWQRFEDHLQEIFEALGLAVGSAATADTPSLSARPRRRHQRLRGRRKAGHRLRDRMSRRFGLPDQPDRRRTDPVLRPL